MITVAALYVDIKNGPYPSISGVDCWGIERDATKYDGLDPVVAHPPCAPWGKLSWSHDRSVSRGNKCKDGMRECGPIAVDQVRENGGVLEHPDGSGLFPYMGVPKVGGREDRFGGFTIKVDQFGFGHEAKKPTLLYLVRVDRSLVNSIPVFERRKGSPVKFDIMKKSERHVTPYAFASWLVFLARNAKR